MRKFIMFITAVCVLFLIKLRWPRNKSLPDLAKIPENSGWNVNGKAIFRKFHPELLDYLLRYFSFSGRNEPIENYLTI